MCCIASCVDEKPTLDQIHRMYDDNSHGASISWINKKGLAQYKKGLSEDEVFKLVRETPLPFVLHFRQSSFSKDKENKLLNHPFEVTIDSPLRLEGEAEKLLIHNGTIREYDLMLATANIQVGKDEPMTDTRAIAMMMAKDNEKLPWRIPGKFVLIDSTRDKGKFRLTGDFTLEGGILYSNLSWKWGNKSFYNNPSGGLTDDEYYNFLLGGELPPEFELDEKKKIVKKTIKETKEATGKTQVSTNVNAGSKEYFVYQLDDSITEQQYNAGIFYRKPKTKKTVDADEIGNRSDYLKAGMKERRKWWLGGGYIISKQKKLNDISNLVTKHQCYVCKGFLPFYRVNLLNVVGFPPEEYICKTCQELSGSSIYNMPIRVDNFKEKTTRHMALSSCCGL